MRIVGIALLTAALVAAVLILIAYERDIRAARERVATGSQIAQTPCGPIEYTSLGSRPALLVETVLRSDFLFWAIIRLAPQTVMRSILATPPEVVSRAPAEEQERIARVMEAILPVSPRRLGLLNDATVIAGLGRYDLERITAPTLAISAADDLFGTYETARYSAEHIPGARFIGYDTGGHLWVGHHREILAAIATFLKR